MLGRILGRDNESVVLDKPRFLPLYPTFHLFQLTLPQSTYAVATPFFLHSGFDADNCLVLGDTIPAMESGLARSGEPIAGAVFGSFAYQ